MANVIRSNEERAEVTKRVMSSYGVHHNDAMGREAAEVIAARSLEARGKARREENRRYY